MNIQKKLSLVMPVYNTAEYLEKCIRSVLDQTYRNLELICVDDGSTDGSGEIVDRLAAEDNRIVVIHQKNAGESAARNVGLRKASGDYWSFIDCDDWLEPDMYEQLISSLEENSADIACGSWFEEFPEDPIEVKCLDTPKDVFDWQQLMYYIYKRDRYRAFGFLWDKVYRKEMFFDENGEMFLFDERMKLGADITYLAQLGTNAKTVTYVDRAFYHYRQRATSGSFSKNIKDRIGALIAYERTIQLLEEKGAWQETIDYAKRFLGYHCILIGEAAIEVGDYDGLKEVREYMKRYHDDYCRMNAEYPERIAQFERIMGEPQLKKIKIYLDNCCFNRPYDDQTQLTIYLEAMAKLAVQEEIRSGKTDLATSYILLTENAANPFATKRNDIKHFIEKYTHTYVSEACELKVKEKARDIMKKGVKLMDACHVACAIISGADYFLSTDKRLLKYQTNDIRIVNPITYLFETKSDEDQQ